MAYPNVTLAVRSEVKCMNSCSLSSCISIILSFYCVNTSYPMDNCFTGRHDRSRQTPEKDVLYIIPAGPVRRAHSPGGASSFLFLPRQHDVIASFSFGAWRVKTCFHDKRIFGSTPNSTAFYPTALRKSLSGLYLRNRKV